MKHEISTHPAGSRYRFEVRILNDDGSHHATAQSRHTYSTRGEAFAQAVRAIPAGSEYVYLASEKRETVT